MLILICDICRNQIDHGAIRIRASKLLLETDVSGEPRSQKVDICKVCIEHIKSLRAKTPSLPSGRGCIIGDGPTDPVYAKSDQ